MPTIIETVFSKAGMTDVFKAPSRLAAIPYDGLLTFEITATTSTADDGVLVTIKLPDGSVPILSQQVPAGWFTEEVSQPKGTQPDASNWIWKGHNIVFHNDTEMLLTFPAVTGGHFDVDMVIKGDTSKEPPDRDWAIRATLVS